MKKGVEKRIKLTAFGFTFIPFSGKKKGREKKRLCCDWIREK